MDCVKSQNMTCDFVRVPCVVKVDEVIESFTQRVWRGRCLLCLTHHLTERQIMSVSVCVYDCVTDSCVWAQRLKVYLSGLRDCSALLIPSLRTDSSCSICLITVSGSSSSIPEFNQNKGSPYIANRNTELHVDILNTTAALHNNSAKRLGYYYTYIIILV